MTKLHPTTSGTGHRHDYLPAAGRDALLPFYDLLTKALGVKAIHRALIDQADLASGQRVLEIGSGTGNLSLLAKRSQPGVDLVGCDPDPLALARAQRKSRGLDGIRFERAYAQRLPYQDASFDRVLSALMLHHLDGETKAAAAAEVARVLRPGGSLHLVDFHFETHPKRTTGVHGLMVRRMAKAGHVAESDDAIPGLLSAAGLDCAQVTARRHPVIGRVTYYRATRPV